jgi:hypothetical protein
MTAKLGALSLVLAALMMPVQVAQHPTPEPEPNTAAVMIPIMVGSELREAPDHGSRLLAVLPGTMRPASAWRYPWVQLQFGELSGWVDSEAPAADSGLALLDADLHSQESDHDWSVLIGQTWPVGQKQPPCRTPAALRSY